MHGDEHFQNIKTGSQMQGNVGVKVFALFWTSFQLFFA